MACHQRCLKWNDKSGLPITLTSFTSDQHVSGWMASTQGGVARDTLAPALICSSFSLQLLTGPLRTVHLSTGRSHLRPSWWYQMETS